MAVSNWEWLNSDKALSCCLALRLLSCFESVNQITLRFNKERFQLAENLRSARCSPFVISKVVAARMRKLITARARKNKRTARQGHGPSEIQAILHLVDCTPPHVNKARDCFTIISVKLHL